MNVRQRSSRPLVIYLDRYPPEIEAVQYAAMSRLIKLLISKYDVMYLSMKSAEPDERIRDGISVWELPFCVKQKNAFDKWTKTIFYYLFLPLTLWRLKRVRPSFIICKEQLPFIPYFVSLLNIPMFIDISDWWLLILLGGSKLGRKIAGCLQRWEVRHWNKKHVWVVTHTQAEARVVEEHGMTRNRIRIINTPFPPGVFYPCDAQAERKKLGFGDDLCVVAIHGTIRPGKGYGQLLEWWRDLVKIHPQWRLLIIGGAGGELWCKNKIRHLNLEPYVVMTGWLTTHDDVNRHLNAADCLLAIRRYSKDNEGITTATLFHSLATGIPTVVTGLAGMSEIVRDKTDGFLFEPDNYDSFREVLEYVFSHPEHAEKVGRAGIERARECFDPDKAAQQHVELIDEILNGTAGKN